MLSITRLSAFDNNDFMSELPSTRKYVMVTLRVCIDLDVLSAYFSFGGGVWFLSNPFASKWFEHTSRRPTPDISMKKKRRDLRFN